ncbi:hypothetical protein PtA15_15A393 [Puccinia triticina]|uniref:Uncharacterized protein n=1 Tax=Puccinia triticina TaxID=208348 RepID=A0ABY7D7L6_9BASI|nr:uncharacterized protein PtA15_15A393 [Puccinia triticina]WAQ92000.1 hypothetical protein PtA15_15A393 [Puccinia triticina]
MAGDGSVITRKHKMTVDEACQILNIKNVPFSEGPSQPVVSEELANMLKAYERMYQTNEKTSKYLLSKVVRAKDRISAEVEFLSAESAPEVLLTIPPSPARLTTVDFPRPVCATDSLPVHVVVDDGWQQLSFKLPTILHAAASDTNCSRLASSTCIHLVSVQRPNTLTVSRKIIPDLNRLGLTLLRLHRVVLKTVTRTAGLEHNHTLDQECRALNLGNLRDVQEENIAPLTASPAATSVPQVVKFLDGSGPFTVLGDVILTAPIPAQTASAVISSAPSPAATNVPAAPIPSVILVTTVVVAPPNPNTTTTQTSPGNSNSPAYNPLALGFVLLLAILIILILAATIILLRRQRRRRKHVGIVDRYDATPQEIHYEFNSRLYPQHHHGSQTQAHYLRHSHEHDTPVVTREHEHACLDADRKEKEMPALQTEFLLTPQRQPAPAGSKWTRWKKLVPKIFAGKNHHPAHPEYTQPLPKTTPIYVNPYHDPSVNTGTGERVSRWRMACDSLSSSALRLPSTITSYRNELPVKKDLFEQETPVKDQGPPNDPKSAISAIQRGEAKLPAALKQKKSIIPPGLFKSQGHPSRSFGTRTKSSRGSGKGSNQKRYSDASPPLLVAECEDEGSASEVTDPGDSPLDFITIPLRSPPRCRRGTPSSSAAITGIDNSIDSIGCPRSLPPSSPSVPLPSSAKRVRPKKNSLPAFPQPPILSQMSTTHSADDLAPVLRRVPCSSSPALLPSLPITRPLVPKKRNDSSPSKSPSHPRSRMNSHSPIIGSSLDADSGHEVHRYDRTGASKDGVMPSSSSNECPDYPQDPSVFTSDVVPLSNPGGPNPTKTGSQETHNSSATEEDIVFHGYVGSGSIGNTGGVSELGILETSMHAADQSLGPEIETDGGFPRSVHQYSAGKSREESMQLIDGDEFSYTSADLFYVKPQAGHPSGSRWDDRSHDPSPPKYQPLKAHPSTSKSYLKDITEESSSRISYGNERRLGVVSKNFTESDRRNERVNELRNSHRSQLSARVPSSIYSTDPGEIARRASRRSVSSSVLGSIFSLGKGRRCVSYPAGLLNDGESGRNIDIEPILNDARSPLQRIAEKGRHPAGSSEDAAAGEADEAEHGRVYRKRSSGEDERSEGEDDEEADESCRLLFARPALSSRCSRATLGQRLVSIRTTEQAPDTSSYHAPVHNSSAVLSDQANRSHGSSTNHSLL